MRRRFTASLTGRVASALLQTATLGLLARALGVNNFAQVAIVISIVQLCFTALDLGMSTRFLQLSTLRDGKRMLGNAVQLRIVSLLVASVAIIIFAHAGPGRSTPLLGAALLYASGELLGDSSVSLYQGEFRVSKAIVVLISRRLSALTPFLLLVVGANGHLAGICSMSAAGIAGHLFFWIPVLIRARRPLSLLSLVKRNGSLAVSVAAFGLQQSDSLVVSVSTGGSLTGFYAAASRLSNPINLAVSTLIQVFIPELTSLPPDERLAQFRRTRRLVGAVAALVALCGFFSQPIIQLLYGSAYSPATVVLAGIFVASGLSALSQIHLAWLYVAGVPARTAMGLMITVVFGLLLLGAMSWLLGGAGAALAIVVTQCATLIQLWLRYRQTLRNVNPSDGVTIEYP